MTVLRQRMEQALRLRNRRPATIRHDVTCLRNLARYHRLPPDRLGPQQIRDQLDSMMVRGLSTSTWNRHRAAYRFFYRAIPAAIDTARPVRPSARSSG